MDYFFDIVSTIRHMRARVGVPHNKMVDISFEPANMQCAYFVVTDRYRDMIERMAKCRFTYIAVGRACDDFDKQVANGYSPD